jgi:hypothetical protein
MTRSNDDDVMSYLSALHHLQKTAQRLGIDPFRRGEDCPSPSELMHFALGQSTPDTDWIGQHAPGCGYCQVALLSRRAAAGDGAVPEVPEDTESPLVEEPNGPELEPVSVVSPGTDIKAETSRGFTQMAAEPQLWPQLIKELRPWVRPLLERAGLDAGWANEFLDDVQKRLQDRLPTLNKQRFMTMLDRWCEEFARNKNSTPTWRIATATLADFEPWATRIVLSEQPPEEEERVARLRDAGLAQEFLTRDELLNLSVPEEANSPWVADVVQEWYFQAGVRLERARELFEVD